MTEEHLEVMHERCDAIADDARERRLRRLSVSIETTPSTEFQRRPRERMETTGVSVYNARMTMKPTRRNI